MASLESFSIVTAFFRALAALAAPPLQRVVGLSLGLAVLTFAVLWAAVALMVEEWVRFGWRPLDWIVDSLGGLAALTLTWLLFPAVVTLMAGFFVERIALAVERTDYPDRGPPRNQPLVESVAVMLRLAGLTMVLNILALPLYLLVPGINLVLFLALNGYLLGRGYFEVVAFRRLDAPKVKVLRSRFSGRVFIGGVAVAVLFTLPLVNLLAPVIATVFMLHVFEALPRIEPSLAARSTA
ncbi:MAG TPA: EI24 domain-containing protein [Stellaceae bacterium]|nr:EI24 domain-containing protein [Stellaceae bacterium]